MRRHNVDEREACAHLHTLHSPSKSHGITGALLGWSRVPAPDRVIKYSYRAAYPLIGKVWGVGRGPDTCRRQSSLLLYSSDPHTVSDKDRLSVKRPRQQESHRKSCHAVVCPSVVIPPPPWISAFTPSLQTVQLELLESSSWGGGDFSFWPAWIDTRSRFSSAQRAGCVY